MTTEHQNEEIPELTPQSLLGSAIETTPGTTFLQALHTAEGIGDAVEKIAEFTNSCRKAQIGMAPLPDQPGQTALVSFGVDNQMEILDPTDFDLWRSQPRRIEDRFEARKLPSFIDYVNRFKTEHTALFAVSDGVGDAKLFAKIDYHQGRNADVTPSWCDHRANFEFPLSVEWKAWTAQNGSWMPSAKFAEFIEDRIVDVLAPPEASQLPEAIVQLIGAFGKEARLGTPATMFSLGKGLRVSQRMEAAEANNLSTGEGEIVFKTENTSTTTAKGHKVEVPTMFLIGIPVLESGDAYRIAARLRYRVDGGSVFFRYDLWRADKTFETVFLDVAHEAAAETGCELFFGH